MKLAVLTAAVVLLTSPVAWTYDLSKAETAANVPDSGNQGATFPVDSTEPAWQNSGVWVKAGQHVEVEANPKDLWDIGWGPTTAAGYPEQHDPNGGLPQYHLGKMNTDWHYGALICAVGKDRKEGKDPQNEVEIGMKRGFTVDRDGWLYFICNDNDAAPATGLPGYGDNSGIVHIRITVKDHAPSTGATPNIFDAQSDFSGAKNPHGVWTYGWTDELNGKLHVYGDTYVKYDGTDWTDDTILDSGAPQLAYHPRFFPEDNHIPAKVMLIHPGPQGEYSHCRCTIPKAGMYDIDASFAALDIGDPHVYLLKNGKPLGETVLSKGSPWTKSFKNISLEAGDRIDAAAGVGASGSFHNDETQFSLTIKPAQTDRGSAAGDVAAEVLKQIQAPLKEMVEEAVEKALKKSSQPAPSASATPAASQSPAPAENPLPPGTADTSGGFRN